MAGHWSLQSFKPQGRGPVPRPESFGRYDPINHSLLIDVPSPVPPGSKHAPIGIKVGNKGRLHAVLDSHDKEVLDRAKQAGVPMSEPLAARHEYHKGHVKRKEDFGRFDPISAQLTFQKSDGSEHTVRVGDNGRLRAVFESGHVDSSEARAIGLPEPERYKGKGVNTLDHGHFNPLTHAYETGARARDNKHPHTSGGKKTWTVDRAASLTPRSNLTPRFNMMTHNLDTVNSTATSLAMYDPRMLSPRNLHVVPQDHIISHGFHAAEAHWRVNPDAGGHSGLETKPLLSAVR